MDGNNRPQLGMRTSGDVGSPQHDFGGIKPRDYNYTGMQAAGDVAGQLLRVGKPFAEATKINMGIERHERDMAGKERIRSLVVATQQLGGIMSRATPNNAHIFEEINKTPEAQEFIGGQLKVGDTGETRDGNPLYFFNILDPKTGESINEIQATTAEAVNMFDGMLAPEMQRQVRETSRFSAKARKRIKDVLEKYSTKEGNIIDLVAEGIKLSPLQQEVLDNIFLHGSKSQQEIAAQLISDAADEKKQKWERKTAEEGRLEAKEKREAMESAVDVALKEARTKKVRAETGQIGKAKPTKLEKPESAIDALTESEKLWRIIDDSENKSMEGQINSGSLRNFNDLQRQRNLPLVNEQKNAEGTYEQVPDVSIYVNKGDKLEKAKAGSGIEYIKNLPVQTQELVMQVVAERQAGKANKLREKRKGRQEKANVQRKAMESQQATETAASKRNILYRQADEAIRR